MSRSRKSKLELISRKVIPIQTLEDNGEKYIGFCNFHYHRGVIGHMKAKACERRNCKYYKKFIEE